MRARLDALLGWELIRFGLVGVINTCLDLGIYFALQLGGTPVLLANLVSTSAGLAFSFVANRIFTFSARPSGGPRRQLLLFVLCTGVGLWILQPAVILGAEGLLSGSASLGDLRILLAKLAAIACGMAWNWTLYNRVVFRSSGGQSALHERDLAAKLAPVAPGQR